jgi:hypothetical protein
MRLVESSETVPLGLLHGAAQVTVKLELPVIGATGSLNWALMTVLLAATPVALATGAVAVTVGGDGFGGGGVTTAAAVVKVQT